MSSFKEYHISGELVDRTNEFDLLLSEIIQTSRSQSTIICAHTGVGKSALSRKISQNIDNTYDIIIRVKTDPENSTTNYKEGNFLSKIFAKTVETANMNFNKKYTFSFFISHSKSKSLKKASREHFFEDIFGADNNFLICKIFIYYLFRRLFKLGEFNSDSLINEDRSSNMRIMNYYMQYILSNLRALIIIDNIQNIDETSLTYILSWMNEFKLKKHYYLYEYTIDKNNTFQNAIQLTEKLKDTGVTINLRKLENLEDTYALDALKIATPYKKYTVNDENAVKYYYRKVGCGNIRKLLDYDCDYSYSDIDLYDPTYEKLKDLSKEEIYIIAIIILCNGSISTTLYEGIFQNDPLIRDRMGLLESLSRNETRILEISNGSINIEHASIIDSWNKHEMEFLEYSLLAYSRLHTFLKKEIESSSSFYISKHKATILLLQLYKKFDFELIIELLDEVKKLSLIELSVNSVWEILKIIVDATSSKAIAYIKIYTKIIEICYKCELYKNGLNCIQVLESFSELEYLNLYIYKCMFLSALDKHNESIIVASTILTKWSEDLRAELNAKIIMLNNNRSINNAEECYKIGNEIEANDQYKQYPEYGYFLRLSHLYLNRKSSINKVKESVDFFAELGNDIQEAKSLITYANHLTVIGQLYEAKKALSKAERKLKNINYGKHILLVNKVAIMLLDNDFSDSVWELLEQAELSAVVPFDKLAILNNKLIWCIENKSYSKTDLIINQINRLLQFEPDKHIHSFMNYNIYLFYSDIKVYSEAEKFYKKADELKEYCSTLNLRLTHKTDESKKYLLNKRWHICLLEYWTFDLLMQ